MLLVVSYKGCVELATWKVVFGRGGNYFREARQKL